MKQKTKPAVISARAEMSHLVEEVASRLGFDYREEAVESETIVRFHFSLSPSDTMRLIQSIPREVYAFRGEFHGSGENGPTGKSPI